MAGVGEILASMSTRCPNCATALEPNELINEFFRQVVERLKAGERVQVTGFGSFTPGMIAGRTVRKPPPRKGAKRSKKSPEAFVEVPDREVVRFKMADALKAAMNDEPLPEPRKDRVAKGVTPKNKPVVGRRTGLG